MCSFDRDLIRKINCINAYFRNCNCLNSILWSATPTFSCWGPYIIILCSLWSEGWWYADWIFSSRLPYFFILSEGKVWLIVFAEFQEQSEKTTGICGSLNNITYNVIPSSGITYSDTGAEMLDPPVNSTFSVLPRVSDEVLEKVPAIDETFDVRTMQVEGNPPPDEASFHGKYVSVLTSLVGTGIT